MKIIHANKYYYDRAGAENYMLNLMRLQEEAGHQVAPFSMHYPKNLGSVWSDYFVSEISTEKGIGRGLKKIQQFRRALWSREAYSKMLKMIDAFKPDIVHVHNIYTQISPSILKACRVKNIPVVMTAHDYALISANHALWNGNRSMEFDKLGILVTAKTKFIKNSYFGTLALSIIQKIHLLTKAFDRNISHYFACSKCQQKIITDNGFSVEKFSVLFPFISDEYIAKKTKVGNYVLYIGRLERYKGVHILIEAMKRLPDIKLKIAGTGSYDKELHEMASEMNNVEFLGWVSGEDKDKILKNALVGVAPSIWAEPSGVSIFELMKLGIPVITSDMGGMQEIVEDKISGRVFEAGNVDSLVSVLGEFISDKKYVFSLGESALIRARELGNPTKHLMKIVDVYQKVLVNKE